MKKRKKLIGYAFIILASILAVTVLFMNVTRGNIVVTGQNPPNIRGESLTCTSSQLYPVFSYDNSLAKLIRINVGFYNNEVDSISLLSELFYDDARKIVASEAHNHGAMNIDFGKNGLDVDAFNANYSRMEDRMRMSLFIKSDQINAIAAKYFMINVADNAHMPTELNEYKKHYESQGFNCNTK